MSDVRCRKKKAEKGRLPLGEGECGAGIFGRLAGEVAVELSVGLGNSSKIVPSLWNGLVTAGDSEVIESAAN